MAEILSENHEYQIINWSIPGRNGCNFADDIIKMYFHEWKFLYFDSNFSEVCF